MWSYQELSIPATKYQVGAPQKLPDARKPVIHCNSFGWMFLTAKYTSVQQSKISIIYGKYARESVRNLRVCTTQ